MFEEGVIGYIAMTSLTLWATYAAASLPSMSTFGRLAVVLDNLPSCGVLKFGIEVP
jgi:hypothetical protein